MNISHLGPSLLRKIKIALPQLAKQTTQWHDMSAGMDQRQVSGWLEEIVAWESDPLRPNPFQSRSTSMSQADVRLKLAQQDALDLLTVGKSISTETGPSAMIYMGLELEESR
jgi:hypothetical protein